MLTNDSTPKAFYDFLVRQDLSEGFWATQDGKLNASSPALGELTTALRESPNYNAHEGIFFQVDQETQSLFFAFVHKTKRGQAAGGTRFKTYGTIGEILNDGMRLAEGMTLKNATAGIWWGGGKGIIMPLTGHPRSIEGELRTKTFANYGLFISKLNGLYSTAEDMNTTPEDMRVIHANCRFCTCLPAEIGGSTNPSIFTAQGVFQGIKAALHFRYGKEATFEGKHVLVQGVGNVGFHVVRQLIEEGANISYFDVSERSINAIKERYTTNQAMLVDSFETLLNMKADIFSPNAIGGILTSENIAKLKVEIVAGGANNQLEFADKNSKELFDRGITYLPDYFINRMGIINCANEQYGYLESDIELETKKVYTDSLALLKGAKALNISPYGHSITLAEKQSNELHPIWGHRGKKILEKILPSFRPTTMA